MKQEHTHICGIPAIIYGEPSDSVYIYVHGKCGSKEVAEPFASLADSRGYQTLAFDLPAHGDRRNVCSLCAPEECNIFTGTRDLTSVADFAEAKWARRSLFACSLGAYFSLCTYANRGLTRALFQSPIVDMIELTRTVSERYAITEDELRVKKRIATPIDLLDWDYYQWIIAHPVESWDVPTAILYAGRDDLQTRAALERFSAKFGAKLTVSETSEHPFMGFGDDEIVANWLNSNLI